MRRPGLLAVSNDTADCCGGGEVSSACAVAVLALVESGGAEGGLTSGTAVITAISNHTSTTSYFAIPLDGACRSPLYLTISTT